MTTDHPWFKYVQKAFELGILGACGPGAFSPDAAMTRADVAGPLVKALIYRNGPRRAIPRGDDPNAGPGPPRRDRVEP